MNLYVCLCDERKVPVVHFETCKRNLVTCMHNLAYGIFCPHFLFTVIKIALFICIDISTKQKMY